MIWLEFPRRSVYFDQMILTLGNDGTLCSVFAGKWGIDFENEFSDKLNPTEEELSLALMSIPDPRKRNMFLEHYNGNIDIVEAALDSVKIDEETYFEVR